MTRNLISRLQPSQTALIATGLLIPKILLYISLIPPWQIPDEPSHFEYIYVLARQNHPFVGVQPDLDLQEQILKSMKDHRFWSYLPFPEPATPPQSFSEDRFLRQAPSQIHRALPLYYVLGSLWLRLFSPGTILEALYLLRLYSALLTLLFVFTIAKLVNWVFPGETVLQAGALSFVLFLPQLSFIGGGVNSDNLINLLYAVTVAACVKLTTERSAKWIGVLILLVAACILTKRTGLAAVPLAAFSVLLAYRHHPRILVRGVTITACLIGSLLIAHVLLTWFMPDSARKVITGLTFGWKNLTSTPNIGAGQPLGVTASVLWQSFWASFGWLRVSPPFWLFVPTLLVHFAMAAGAGVAFLDVCRASFGSKDSKTAYARTLLSFSGFLILAAVLIRNLTEFQPQGRYLLPGLPAFAFWFAMGLSLAPRRSRRWLIVVIACWFCFFELVTLFGYALPLFYKEVM